MIVYCRIHGYWLSLLKSLLFGVMFLFVFSITANSQRYNFRNYSVGEGLAQSQVYAICEDKNANIWLGTRGGGVSRFDGINFSNYTEENGLAGNYIRCLLKGKNDIIWIGTDNGLSSYDGQKFHSYTAQQGLYNESVNCIMQDKAGILWIGTEKGIFHFDGDSIYRFGRKLGAPMERINCLLEDSKGTIWAGTEIGLYAFDVRQSRWSMQVLDKRQGLPDNIIRSVQEDVYHNLWIATYSGGVACRTADGALLHYSVKDGLAGNTVLSCTLGEPGVVWLGTATGASRLSVREDGTIVSIQTYTHTEGLPNNVVMNIYRDSFHNIWFGTSGGGVGMLDSERFVHYGNIKNIFGNWVYAVHQDRRGVMWFGTSEGGVTKYDGKYYKRYSRADGMTADKVKTIHEDGEGNIWLGTISDGVYKYDGKAFYHIRGNHGLGSNFINCITSDHSGNVWLGTAGGGIAVVRYSGSKFKIKRITPKDGMAGDRVVALYHDQKGNVWAGTSDKGVSCIRLAKDSSTYEIINFTKQNGLGSNKIKAVTGDSSGTVYFGTGDAGIRVYKGSSFSSITKEDGLSSNIIYSLIFDREGNLWAGTEKGIEKITFLSSGIEVKHFGKAEGFEGIEAMQNAISTDSSGNVWFGTIGGATRYSPLRDLSDKRPPVTRITGIRLFFDKIENTLYAGVPLPWNPLPSALVLPYDQNHISFEYAGIHLKNPEAVRYRYQLKGFDKAWSPETNRREATYSNLPAGKYVFYVMACNEDGVWNAQPASFSFVIEAPFWDTLWFKAGTIAVLGLIIALVLLAWLRGMKRKNEEEKQILQMERNLIALEQKALRMQMNPHFLFNCLNSIKGLIAQGGQEDAKLYLSRFGKLMRFMLESSKEEYITLEAEVAALNNYAQLEKLSREDKFDFTVEIDERINPAVTEIPPMLIQPFVENAILHGIAPKEGRGCIKVRFEDGQANLICTIEDDGIGREQSALLKTQSLHQHKSAAIAVTQERLNILNKKLHLGEVNIRLADLKDANGAVAGTKVELVIPYRK